jgi:hypothetical protein
MRHKDWPRDDRNHDRYDNPTPCNGQASGMYRIHCSSQCYMRRLTRVLILSPETVGAAAAAAGARAQM